MNFLSPKFAGSFGKAVTRTGSRLAVLLAAFFVIFATQALAQEATILGTVTDPTGATVANATIAITNTDTGVTRSLPTNGDGQYVAPDLIIGHYTVHATAAGFKAGRAKGNYSSTSMTAPASTSNWKSAALRRPSRSRPTPSPCKPIPARSATSSTDNR